MAPLLLLKLVFATLLHLRAARAPRAADAAARPHPRPQFWFSHLPSRFNAWREHGVTGRISPLPQLSAAWLAAYHQYFADSGWEDLGTQGPPVEFPSDTGHSNGETDLTRAPRGGEEAARRKEAAFVRRGGPHWYSVRQPR